MKKKSIAVLPFSNFSLGDESEYFSDGITEEIIKALTTIKGLNVTARTSSFAFKNKDLDVRVIGKQLGVATILEGSIRKYNNQIRITAQLIDTANGFYLWSGSIESELDDVFALQDKVSLLIADKIRENFGHLDVDDHLVELSQISTASYELYLKAKHLLHTYNKENIKKGIELLKQVIENNPDFALAYLNVHYGYNLLAAAGHLPKVEALKKGESYLNKVAFLSDKLPEYYHSLGWHLLNLDWDFVLARKNFEKAIELRPGYSDAYQKLFITFALEGKMSQAFKCLSKSLALDPLSPLNFYFLGYYHYLKRNFSEANLAFQKCIELEPSFLFCYGIYTLSLLGQKKVNLALELAKNIPSVEGAEFEVLIIRTLVFCFTKNKQEATLNLQVLNKALKQEESERVRFFLIHMQNFLQDTESVLELVEEGVNKKEPLMTLLREDPLLKPLHQLVRFKVSIDLVFTLTDEYSTAFLEESSVSWDNKDVELYLSRLKKLIEIDKVFLNPNLSLRTLAKDIDLNSNKLSFLLNEKLGKNFNEYINSYRLEEFKRKALDPDNSNYTLLSLAFESGFTSKTVFNTFFKKQEGLSPRDWLNANTLVK